MFLLGCNFFRVGCFFHNPSRVEPFLSGVHVSFLPGVQHFPSGLQFFSFRVLPFLNTPRVLPF